MKIAIPDMVTSLNTSLDQVLWSGNVYTLVYPAFQLLAGRLVIGFGPRNVFIVGLALFTLASTACGVAGAEQMIVMWAVQGFGAAALNAVVSVGAAGSPGA